MRQVSISRIRPGDILATTILSPQGHVLVNSGVTLSSPIIKRLRDLGITMVNIDDPNSKDVVMKDVISFERRREAMMAVEASGEAVRKGKDLDTARLKEIVGNIVEDILFEKHIILSLMDIRTYDTQIFSHAVSVCTIAVVIGKALRLDREKLNILASGALLHDIGMINLSRDILRKRQPFTPAELELYQSHTDEGFKILRSRPDTSLIISHIAYQHHEALDGSGYPRSLTGNKIHPLAQIVALADLYDNLVNDGPGHERINPNEAIEVIMGSAGRLFPHTLVKAFLDHTAVYPTGCTVELNTGELAIVIDQNRSLPARPVVRVLPGNSTNSNTTYDLVEHLTMYIKKIIT